MRTIACIVLALGATALLGGCTSTSTSSAKSDGGYAYGPYGYSYGEVQDQGGSQPRQADQHQPDTHQDTHYVHE